MVKESRGGVVSRVEFGQKGERMSIDGEVLKV